MHHGNGLGVLILLGFVALIIWAFATANDDSDDDKDKKITIINNLPAAETKDKANV